MPKNDDGEFELVLGNRQLISVFLIVVVLLGVFFSMGYIVGRNSLPPSETAQNNKHTPDQDADSSTGDAQPDAAAPAPAPDATTPAAADSTPQAAPPEATKPAQPERSVAPAKPEPVHTAERKAKPSPVASSDRPPVRAAASGTPSGGEYWQVVATARPDAEIVAEALGKKGFHAVLAPAPKEGIFRVLVGPLPDAATQAQTRTGLESAGFKNPIIRKY